MTVPTLLAGSEILPYSTTSITAPGVAVLPDDTILVAWGPTGGDVVVRHYSRDLSTLLGATTLAVPVGSLALALLATTEGRVLLAVDAVSGSGGSSWWVSTDPLTLTPGPGYAANLGWGSGPLSAAAAGDVMAYAAGVGVALVQTDGTIGATFLPGDQTTGLAPGTGSTVHVSTTEWDGDGDVTTVWALDVNAGTYAAVTAGPSVAVSHPMPAVQAGAGWVFPSMEWTGAGDHLHVRTADGAATYGPGWPEVDGYFIGLQAGMVEHRGTSILPTFVRRSVGVGEDWDARMGLVVHDGTSVTVTDLDLPTTLRVAGLSTTSSPIVVHNGRTAVVALGAFQDFPGGTGSDKWGLTLWTFDLGAHEGRLAVDTLDIPWWIVGTRDPDMAYELLIDTPTGWVVEIVAGEEHLATWELMVDAGPDEGWVECALFRPV